MKKILFILGVVFIILGIALGLYLGLYVMLYGGIMQIINSIEPFHAKELVIGILKVLFCEASGIVTWLGFMVGGILIAISE